MRNAASSVQQGGVFPLPHGGFFQLIHISDGLFRLKRHWSVAAQINQPDYNPPVPFKSSGWEEITLAAEAEHLEVIALMEAVFASRGDVHGDAGNDPPLYGQKK